MMGKDGTSPRRRRVTAWRMVRTTPFVPVRARVARAAPQNPAAAGAEQQTVDLGAGRSLITLAIPSERQDAGRRRHDPEDARPDLADPPLLPMHDQTGELHPSPEIVRNHGAPAPKPSAADALSVRICLVERLYLLMDKAINQGWQATMCLAVLLLVLGGIIGALGLIVRG